MLIIKFNEMTDQDNLRNNRHDTSHVIRVEPRHNCLLCGSVGERLYTNLEDSWFDAPGFWNISQCKNADCGLIWLDPMPLEEDIANAYHNYYTHSSVPIPRSLASKMLFTVLGLEQDRHNIELYYLKNRRPARLLEVGFGDARRLQKFSELGWEVEGEEVDPVAISNATEKNLKVHHGWLQDLGLPANKYDVVVGNHVIEHVHDPVGFLAECRRVLKPGGRVVMITPNARSYGHEHFLQAWFPLDPPRHLHIFSSVNIRELADLAGLQVQSVNNTLSRSATYYQACLDLKRYGRYKVGAKPTLGQYLFVAWNLFNARARQIAGLAEGDDLVLTAIKPT